MSNNIWLVYMKKILFQGSYKSCVNHRLRDLCFPFTVILPKQSQQFATRDSFVLLLKVADKIYSPRFLIWWNTTRDVLPSAVPLMAAGSDRFSTLQLLTGNLWTIYRQRGAWPDQALIWSFHFSGKLGARGQSQAYRFAARLQYLHAINSLAVTVFVETQTQSLLLLSGLEHLLQSVA